MTVRFAFALAVLGAIAVAFGPAGAQEKGLKVGDAAPVFESVDDQGKPWKSADHVGKKIVVVFFYPADFTGGCTKQACGFRDDLAKLTDKGVEVVGVSGDSAKTHAQFKKEHKLPFTLLADEKGETATKFGVPVKVGEAKAKVKVGGEETEIVRGATIQRWTFVIGKDGKVVYVNPKVTAPNDSKDVLEVVEKLKK
jgi:peroxiredoxin Q/BCP